MTSRIGETVSFIGTVVAPFVLAFGLVSSAFAAEEHFLVDGYGVSGHDPVAYHTKGQPTVGDSAFTATHEGVTYRFASAANRDTFEADPETYAPQYGGFCAFGTAMGRKFPGDPNAWRIVDGKLYLNLNKDVQAQWVTDIPGFIRGADHNWPIIRTVADASLEANPPANISLGAQ